MCDEDKAGMGEKCASRSRFDVSFVSLDTHPPKSTTTRTQALSSLNTASTTFCYRRRRSVRSNACITRPNLIQFPFKNNCPSPTLIYAVCYIWINYISSISLHFKSSGRTIWMQRTARSGLANHRTHTLRLSAQTRQVVSSK